MGYITPQLQKFPGYLSPSMGLKFADIPNGLAAISKARPLLPAGAHSADPPSPLVVQRGSEREGCSPQHRSAGIVPHCRWPLSLRRLTSSAAARLRRGRPQGWGDGMSSRRDPHPWQRGLRG